MSRKESATDVGSTVREIKEAMRCGQDFLDSRPALKSLPLWQSSLFLADVSDILEQLAASKVKEGEENVWQDPEAYGLCSGHGN